MSFLKDLTAGNPFSTRIGQLIEQSTDGNQASENWAMFMEICDIVNETEEGPKDACKAIKKRFSTSGKNYTTVMYTLTVLETCVKNCGRRFHLQIAHKDFMQEMVKVIGPKNDPPTAVQEKVLSMIQNWADAFQGQPEMKEICKTYQELKNKGIEFPMTDLDSMAPIHTPARMGPDPTPASRPPSQAPSVRVAAQPAPVQVMRQPAPQPQQPVPAGPVMLSPEQLGKLKTELDVVQQNCSVFSEMLTELTPGQETPSDTELLNELNRSCKSMQQRIMELIDKVQNEEVTCELLHINDELNNVFLRYARFERLRSGQQQTAGQRSPAQPPPANSYAPPEYNAEMQVARPATAANSYAPPEYNAEMQPAGLPPPPTRGGAAATPTTGAAIPNLIDFGDTPSPKPTQTDPFSLTQPQQPTNDINSRLAGLSVGPSTTSQLEGLTSTEATTGSQPPPAYPGAQSDDFDMFAQSRQSFDQNKQPGQGGSTYSAQQQDSFPGGLGSAVTAKSTANPFSQNQSDKPPELIDSDKDFAEMEEWLKQNPASTQEPATSSEFDQFLQDRAGDSQANGNRASGTNNRRQMQKDEQEDAMFAL